MYSQWLYQCVHIVYFGCLWLIVGLPGPFFFLLLVVILSLSLFWVIGCNSYIYIYIWKRQVVRDKNGSEKLPTHDGDVVCNGY